MSSYDLPASYDRWKTTPPDENWGHCPTCGCSQEDASCYGEEYVCPEYVCPECGMTYSDSEAHPDPRDAREEALLDRAGL